MPTLYLHIGTRKSGTTFVQRTLRASAPALAEQGLGLVFPDRRSEVAAVLGPLRRYVAGGDAEEARAGLRSMVDGILASPLERHLVTLEDLGTLPEAAAELYHSALEGIDVELIVTARHWGVTIPSEWQQRVKQGLTTSYPDFLDAIRDRTPDSEGFYQCQDVPAMVRRWRGSLPDERVHVLAVPPRSSTPGLMDLFCGLVQVDPERLTDAPRAANSSLGMAEAETLRQVNRALRGRLKDDQRGGPYYEGVRDWLTRRHLMLRDNPSIGIPTEHVAWVQEAARRQADEVAALGVDVVGSLEHLVPSEDLTRHPSDVDEGQVAAVAVELLADLAVERAGQRQKRASGAPDARPAGWRRLLGRS